MNPYTNNTNNNTPFYNKNGFELNQVSDKPSQLNSNSNYSSFFASSSTPYLPNNMLHNNNFTNDKIGVSYDFYSSPTFCDKVSFQNMKGNFYENYHDDFIKFSNEKNINIKPTHEIKQKTSKSLQKSNNESDILPKTPERVNWTFQETRYLIEVMAIFYPELKKQKLNSAKGQIWDKIADKHCKNYSFRNKKMIQVL